MYNSILFLRCAPCFLRCVILIHLLYFFALSVLVHFVLPDVPVYLFALCLLVYFFILSVIGYFLVPRPTYVLTTAETLREILSSDDPG